MNYLDTAFNRKLAQRIADHRQLKIDWMTSAPRGGSIDEIAINSIKTSATFSALDLVRDWCIEIEKEINSE